MKKMMGSFVTVMMLIAATASMASAGILTLEGKAEKKIEGVDLAPNAKLTVADGSYAVSSVGAGLRTKKVLMAKVKVYVAQLFVANANRFSNKADEALASLEDSDTVIMNLSFLRRVEAEKVRTSFLEALSTNKVNLKDAAIAQFLNAVETSGDALEGKTFVIAIHKNSDGSETLSFEDSQGKVSTIIGEKGFTHSVFSMWLGIPADDGLIQLKDQILGK